MVRIVGLISSNRVLFALVPLALVVAIVYAPVLGMGFVSDDYIFVNLMHFTVNNSLSGDHPEALLQSMASWSITDVVNGAPAVRPVNTWLLMSDYLMTRDGPLGYHLTSLFLHVLCSFIVLLVTWKLSSNRWAAGLAGLFFAILPIHAEAVAWVAARDHVLAGLFFELSFFFYIKSSRPHLYILSLASFILALASKETSVTLPLILAIYHAVYGRRGVSDLVHAAKRTAPFWLILVAYLCIRFMLYGTLGAPPYARGGIDSWSYRLSGYTMFTTDPLLSDINDGQAFVLAAILIGILWVYRSRPTVVFGVAWIPVTLIVMISLPVEARYFYIPSIGLALALAGIVADPLPILYKFSLWARYILIVILVGAFGAVLNSRSQNWRNAGDVADRVLAELKSLHPTLAPDSRVVFVGVPERLRSAFVFITGIQAAIQLTYNDPTLQAFIAGNFPIVMDRLDRTYFFEYDNRQMVERADLVRRLELARTCSPQNPVLAWTFADDTQGWEAWSDISSFAVNDRTLRIQAVGTDPIIASPVIDVAPEDLEHFEMTLGARSSSDRLTATLYWQTLSMKDFSPGMNRKLQIQADGLVHIYRLDLTGAGSSLGNDHLVRLRLDPVDQPADIRIESIKLVCHW